MSFILDALKKAESERSRNSGPVLMDVRIARSRQRLPVWAWVLGCGLLANLAILSWLLFRETPATPAPVPAVATLAPPADPAPARTAPPPANVVEPVLLPAPAAVAPPPAASPAPAPAAMPVPVPPPVPLLSPRVDNLPTLQDLIAQGVSLPALQLNLHVYDEAAASRYVLLNARRLREGDEVADGIRVEAIVPSGVVLNARGRRFVLLAGG